MKNKKSAKAAESDRGVRAANVSQAIKGVKAANASEAIKGDKAEITSETAGKCGPAGFFRENALFCLLFCGMGIYYLWRMFSIPPWYDELYTYENFIDRGMIYSMIHWPLPNNHVFFSALSAVLNKLGSPYIGLRGVSFLASMGSLLLLYRILRKAVPANLSTAGVALFAAMYNVVQQAAQGRGYALSGFFLLAAVNCLYEICVPEVRGINAASAGAGQEHKKDGQKDVGRTKGAWKINRRFWYYAGFAACLTGGLYTIASNLYWVVPVCMAGGLYLLFSGKYKTLFRLIGASLAAALATFGLYTIIWLAIGSNFLVKEEAGPFFGKGHFYVLLHAPFAAFSRGMQAMLSDPNIQSIDRSRFNSEFIMYLERVANQVYPNGGRILLVLTAVGLVLALLLCIRAFRRKDMSVFFLALYTVVLTVMVPVFLTVQCVFPYLRVFTYMGSVLAMLFVLMVYAGADMVRSLMVKWKGTESLARVGKAAALVFAGAGILFSVYSCRLPEYNAGYDSRDNHIYAALKQLDEQEVDTVLVGDVYARLNLYFHIRRCRGKELVMDYEQPDYVLMDKVQTGPEGEALVWPYEMNTQDFPWEWIEEHMEVVFEDDSYIAYQVVR
ncbi:ArnT family glycosyltransferase [Eisenbergiella sp.]